MRGEFDLIRQYFSRTAGESVSLGTGVVLGVADDCAIFSSHHQIATSKDLLVEGQHFFSDVDPFTLGHKALAVNLSDLAAMGASPIACLLGLALPRIDEQWLSAFSKGFYQLSDKYHCPLIGGDTTKSAHDIVISVTVFGEVSPPYLMRNKAKVGDIIWVSGALGAAHTALMLLFKSQEQALSPQESLLLVHTRQALECPEPRIMLGQSLKSLANAVIDISDGLLQDLGHIMEQSHVHAYLYEEKLPIAEALRSLPTTEVREAVLSGGDVYELCFTAPAKFSEDIGILAKHLGIPLTAIGEVVQVSKGEPTITVFDRFHHKVKMMKKGFDHFASSV
ncbi:thiamine-phosphate kinase [Pelistega sp. NLN82]|uniref:Thiamine-monophosphate kinase n=1 Tax=Pelistega ratti TaxID=2652177 RepID=A0A6L9Y4L3_9BURK|nr:thiamine-phosphate kinase [Pelistega ratti]NEN74724.1 thiamine-phosphate kinase [Pelistega ratti]